MLELTGIASWLQSAWLGCLGDTHPSYGPPTKLTLWELLYSIAAYCGNPCSKFTANCLAGYSPHKKFEITALPHIKATHARPNLIAEFDGLGSLSYDAFQLVAP